MYSAENLEAIEKAISDMHAGRRIVGVSYGDTRVQYANIIAFSLWIYHNNSLIYVSFREM